MLARNDADETGVPPRETISSFKASTLASWIIKMGLSLDRRSFVSGTFWRCSESESGGEGISSGKEPGSSLR